MRCLLIFAVTLPVGAEQSCMANAQGACETDPSQIGPQEHLDDAARDIKKICPIVGTRAESIILSAIGQFKYLVKPASFLGLWPKGIDPNDFATEYFTGLYFIVSRVILRLYKTRTKDWVNVPTTRNDKNDIFRLENIRAPHTDVDGSPNLMWFESVVPDIVMRHIYVPMFTCFYDILRRLAVTDRDLGGQFDDALNNDTINTWQLLLEKGGFKSKLEWVRAFYDGVTAWDGKPQWPQQMTDFTSMYFKNDQWDDLTEYAICFHLIGQHRVESGSWSFKLGDSELNFPFRVPLNDFSKLAVRDGFGNYGVDLYFNDDGLPVFLVTPDGSYVTRGDKLWQYWKFVWRSSLLTIAVTAIDHLHFTHYRASNLLSRSTRLALEPTHPLRRVTSIFSFSGIMINAQAMHLLLGPNHNLHRATGIKDFPMLSKLLPSILPDIVSLPAVKTLFDEEMFDSLHPKLKEAPYFADGRLIARAIRKMVDGFVDIVLPDLCDRRLGFSPEAYALAYEMKLETFEQGYSLDSRYDDLLNQTFDERVFFMSCPEYSLMIRERMSAIFFIVSAFHRHVGFVGDYYENPDFASMSWKAGEAFGRPRQHMILSIINVFTSTSQPLLKENYTHLFKGMVPDREEAFSRVWNNFVQELEGIEVEVDERNKKRKIVNINMSPRVIEASVAK